MPSSRLLYGLCVLIAISFFPHSAEAVLPPDVIFSVGSQVIQFFSFFALIIGGIISSVVMVFRRWLFLSTRHTFIVVGVIFIIVAISIAVVTTLEVRQYQNELQAEIAYLTSLLDRPAPTTLGTGLYFYSDTLTVYGNHDNAPFVLELDINRKQQPSGLYTQYVYLNGTIGGATISDYDQILATSSTVQPNAVIESFTSTVADDLSPRESQHLILNLPTGTMEIVIDSVDADFITKNDLAYTRHHGTTQARIHYNNETFTASAFVGAAYSNDVEKYIFFPGSEFVDSTTHHVILWDEANSLYVIDITETRSDTPQYPSHTWLLHKDVRTGYTRKSYTGTVSESDSLLTITAPEFNDAVITLTNTDTYSTSNGGRSRRLVTGEIRDSDGSRAIAGVAHIVE